MPCKIKPYNSLGKVFRELCDGKYPLGSMNILLFSFSYLSLLAFLRILLLFSFLVFAMQLAKDILNSFSFLITNLNLLKFSYNDLLFNLSQSYTSKSPLLIQVRIILLSEAYVNILNTFLKFELT